MEDFQPNVNVITNTGGYQPQPKKLAWYKTARFLIFILTFSLATAISLIYCYSRPALYRSSATLLTSAMTAIDAPSANIDPQQAAIEREVLLGHELLSKILTSVNQAESNRPTPLTLPELQSILSVAPVGGETHLLELRADGQDRLFLPKLINAWITSYFEAREKEVNTRTTETTHIIEDELNGIASQLNTKRKDLIQFRKNNNILSIGRDENAALARLNGINDSLNRAIEAETKAKTNLDAIKQAIADGQPVVPTQDQGALQDLEKRRQELREKQDKLLRQFTQSYIDLQPSLKVIPEQVKKIELEIINKLDYGKKIVLTEAIKDYAAAKQTVKQIRADLEEHKNTAAEFTTQFAKHETLKTDLESLEKLYRETQERLVQIQSNHAEKYPQVTIINSAFEPEVPISPNYDRDALISVAGSFLLGLFMVWLVDFLNKTDAPQTSPLVTLTGIHMYPTANTQLGALQTQQIRPITQDQLQALPNNSIRELTSHELKVIFNNASLKGKQLIGCLLSGLSPAEVGSLTHDQINFKTNTISINLPSIRVLPLHRPVKALFSESGGHPLWSSNSLAVANEIRVCLLCAAIDSGLPHPAEINAETIYHSYIIYLIRQGILLDELETIVGQLAPAILMSFSIYTPSHRGLHANEVELLHPALVGFS
jgi:uncharacterized protein involved in exopolysaccharide biosynthesis